MQNSVVLTNEEFSHGGPRRWWAHPAIPAAAALLVISGLGLSLWLRHRAQHVAVAPSFQWVTVTTGDVTESVSTSGTLTPAKSVTLTASQPVLQTYVTSGQTVKKGQLIAKLDDTALQLQLESAKATLALAKAKLAQAKEPAAASSYSGPLGNSSQQQQPDQNVIDEAQASVDQAQAQVTALENQIDACTVRSPITGTILQIADGDASTSASSVSNASGQPTPASGSTLAIIANLATSNFEVEASVPQSDMNDVKIGDIATVSLSAASAGTLTGKVVSISYEPQTQNGVTTYPVTIRLDKHQASTQRLLPGEQAAVTIVEKRAHNVLTLPTDALTQRFGVVGVYTKGSESNGQIADYASLSGLRIPSGLTFTPVVTGLYGGNEVQIKSGLKLGQQVAVIFANTTGSTGASTGIASSGFWGFAGMGGFGGVGGAGSGGAFFQRYGTGGYNGERGFGRQTGMMGQGGFSGQMGLGGSQ
ncbi:MAG: HlyD family efflux transporter periplasmic adaptor subunit [Alicyclobacillus sp.]|nr:HlyD family efflux transporter periplasmic adaptor subunit [Alicyclobacillus sp.]